MGKVLERLMSIDAYYIGEHFVLKSGKHSEAYINPDVMLAYPSIVSSIANQMAQPFRSMAHADLVCIGPAFGGNYLAWDVARHLSSASPAKVKWVATSKHGKDQFVIDPGRGFEQLLPGADVLIVEDLLTTGGSVIKLIESLKVYCDFNIIGVTVAINRGGVTAKDLGVALLHSGEELHIETDAPAACRWCAMGRPIVEDIGHGDEFKSKHSDYAGGYVKLLAQ
jgi:orotate phosphoribosyltransferase